MHVPRVMLDISGISDITVSALIDAKALRVHTQCFCSQTVKYTKFYLTNSLIQLSGAENSRGRTLYTNPVFLEVGCQQVSTKSVRVNVNYSR